MVFNAQIKKYGNTQKAIEETIRICQDEDCLREYLERRRTEVEGIMLTLFDQERVTEIYGAEKKAEGIAEGKVEGRIQAIRDMIKIGLTTLSKVKDSGLYTDEELEAISAP